MALSSGHFIYCLVIIIPTSHIWNLGFERLINLPKAIPSSSAGKESTCNAGDPGSIPGLGTFPGERIDYPLQNFGAFLVAQRVKNPPVMQET